MAARLQFRRSTNHHVSLLPVRHPLITCVARAELRPRDRRPTNRSPLEQKDAPLLIVRNISRYSDAAQ